VIPASFAQTRLWLLNQIDGGSTYNLPLTVRLSGALDVDALRAAFGDVVERHETLRTLLREVDGRPVQVIVAADRACPEVVVVDVREEEVAAAVADAAGPAFDLGTDLPLRVRLLRLSAQEHLLVVVLHHIACDGWSLRPLWGDLSAAYTARCAGGAPGWEPLPVQYADYTLWQRVLARGPRGAARGAGPARGPAAAARRRSSRRTRRGGGARTPARQDDAAGP
jgi:hypothetical protein